MVQFDQVLDALLAEAFTALGELVNDVAELVTAFQMLGQIGVPA